MPSLSLNKLYYADKEKYNEEYTLRYNSEDSIHLDFFIGDNQAFFCPNNEIYKRIISIIRIDKKVQQLYLKLPEEAIYQFAKKCLVDEIIQTNNIEGVHSTRKEITDVIEDMPVKNSNNRFVGLVRKYRVLLFDEEIGFRTCEDIRKIYDDIFYEEIKKSDEKNLPDGKLFRKESVSVFSPTDKEIHTGLYPESKIINAMEKALMFLNKESVEPLFRIAVFHYLFGYIHPFYDGNGRCSRFISGYLLSKHLNHLIAYRMSYTIRENISLYYDAFKECNNPKSKGDITPFIEMFLNIVDISENQLCDALQKRVRQLEKYEDIIMSLPYADEERMKKLYSVLVQASLFSDIGVAISEMERFLSISYNTLNKEISKIPSQLISIKMSGRKKYYMLNLKKLDDLYEKNE